MLLRREESSVERGEALVGLQLLLELAGTWSAISGLTCPAELSTLTLSQPQSACSFVVPHITSRISRALARDPCSARLTVLGLAAGSFSFRLRPSHDQASLSIYVVESSRDC
jgi:hypothetical protein